MHASLGKPCKYRLMFKTLPLSKEACRENKLVRKTIGGQSNHARFSCYCMRPPGGVLPEILDRGVPPRFLNPDPI